MSLRIHNLTASLMFSHIYGNSYYGVVWFFQFCSQKKFLQTLKVFADYSHQLSYWISKLSLNHPNFTWTLKAVHNLLWQSLPKRSLAIKNRRKLHLSVKNLNLCSFLVGKPAKQANLRRELFIRAGNNWNQAVATTETEMFFIWWMTTSQNHQLLSNSPRALILCWNLYNSNKQTVLCSLLGPPAVPRVCTS